MPLNFSIEKWMVILLLYNMKEGVTREIHVVGPRFTTEPPFNVEFSNSTGSEIVCTATGQPNPTVNWILPDGSIANNIPGLRQVDKEGKLVFPPFQAENYRQDVHAISYKCVATNSVGTIVSRDVNIRAVMVQPYETHVYDAFPLKDNIAILKCHLPPFIGTHVIVSAWIKNNAVKIDSMTNDNKYHIYSDELFIMNVGENDATSSYRCETTNALTNQTKLSSTAGKLFISDPKSTVSPRIIDNIMSVSVTVDSDVTIPCIAQGFPVPEIEWFVKSSNGQLIPVTFGNRIYKLNTSIKIQQMQVSDAGIYVCEAKSSVGQEKKEINVTVTVPLSVHVKPNQMKLETNKIATLKCVIKGNPIASITWLKNGQPFHFNNLTDLITVEKSGMYQCFAKNEFYMVHDSAQVIAGDKLPEIISAFDEKVIEPGSNLKLECAAMGNPQPNVKWFVDDEEIEQNNRISIRKHQEKTNKINSILEIANLQTEDGGVYSCQFANLKGVSKHSNRINVVGVPGIKPMKKVLGIAGQSVQINCPYYGYPINQIKWIKEMQSLPTDPRQFLHDNGSLWITKMLRGVDDGVYTCVVKNDNKEAKQDVEIVVMIPPNIMPFSFQEDLLREGMRARLQCVVSEGDIPLKIQWLKDSMELPIHLGITVRNLDEFSSILTIANINPKHNGNYTCQAINPAATSTHTAKLNVNVAPKIIPFSFQPKMVAEGAQARVLCGLIEGDVPLTISWLKNGLPISQKDIVIVRTPDNFSSILSIPKVHQTHTGNYTCMASNHAATAEFSSELVVNVPPKIVPFTFQDEHLLEGMLVRVSCVVSRGDLPLTISWLKDGHSISKNESIRVHDFDDYSNILSIDPVTAKHNGNYTCIATNAAATVTYSSTLSVNVPPKWIKMPNDTSVVIGSELHLPCATEGFPKPTVVWTRSEGRTKERRPILNNKDHVVTENGTLHIFVVKEEDKGFYFCEAKNGIGWLGATAQITIKTPPKMLRKSQNISSHKDENVQLQCEATGDMPMEFIWKLDSKTIAPTPSKYVIKNFEKNKISTAQLEILNTNHKDTNKYQCRATNKYGSDEAFIDLIVKDVPIAPTNLKVLEAVNRTMTIEWSLQETPVTKYIVQYKHIKETWKESKQRPVPGKMNRAKISHLLPSQKYQVRILAENEVGLSEPSNIVETIMAEEAPGGAPNDISVIAIDTNTLKVSWKSPPKAYWNGIIRGYYIGYKVAGSSDPYNFRLIEVPEDYTDTLSLSITDLLKFTQYSIVIQAFSDGGKGPLSKEIIAVTSESVPTKAPTDIRCSVLSSQSVHITWQSPPLLAIHGVLQGYKVIFKPVNQLSATNRNANSGIKSTAINKITLNNLMKYANYSFQVLAFTKKGDGLKSDPIYCRTLEDVPGPVADIKVLPASQTSVLVAWKSPDNSNGAITKYTVYVKNDDEAVNHHIVNGNTTFQEITALKQNANYEFWVTASTIVGDGPRSRIVSQSPGIKKIPARVAVFNSAIVTTEDKDVKLPCPAIGIPEPRKKWTRNGNPLELSSRMVVLSDGALLIKDSRRHESDNYTCHVENERGDDLVTYSVLVQSVPGPVIIDIALTTTSSIDILWKIRNDGGAPITGFKLMYKHEHTPWKTIELDFNVESHRLDNLDCGTKYQVYMVAVNDIGEGKASLIITSSTKGGVPQIPNKHNLIDEGSTFITLNLNSWQIDSCPIKYFVLEYKPKLENQWQLYSDDVESDKRKILLSDLKPATWYDLRMIAHSTAGTAVAEYLFATLTPEGATILPEIVVDTAPNSPIALLLDLKFIVIFSTVIIALLIIILTLLCCCSKTNKKSRGHHHGSRTMRGTLQSDGTLTYNGSTVSDGRSGTINSDELTPYATARLTDFVDGKQMYPRPGNNMTTNEILSLRNQFPTAPPMSDSYNSNSLPFYSQIHKGKGNQGPMTPNRSILKGVAMSIPSVPLSQPPEISSQRLIKNENEKNGLPLPPPPPPPMPENSNSDGNITGIQKKYDSPWDLKKK